MNTQLLPTAQDNWKFVRMREAERHDGNDDEFYVP